MKKHAEENNISHEAENTATNKECQHTSVLSRRKFITMAGASVALLSFPISSVLAKGLSETQDKPKVIWVLLRGALDSLHTIIPHSDPQYRALRPKLSASFESPLLALDNVFSLHPALKHMHAWYQDKSMLPIVAVSTGFKQRSHFDGQDFLESGKREIDHDSGWLARAINVKNKQALAVSRTIPISLRNSKQVNTWYPSRLKNKDTDIYAALGKLYQNDEALTQNLEDGIKIKGLVGSDNIKGKKQQGTFVELSKSCAKLMVGNQGPDCAMLELGGWDTHNNQSKRLDKSLIELDSGLAALKEGLGEQWQNTVVIIGTEFGRTAKENGTGGTDHGTGSALFLAGGAVNGGNVKGNWPGLNTNQLYKKRDLMPTSNSFSWFGNVLMEHWQFTDEEISQVFPVNKPYKESLLKKNSAK
jgi:uncharacterized protein (DUF1501 family)